MLTHWSKLYNLRLPLPLVELPANSSETFADMRTSKAVENLNIAAPSPRRRLQGRVPSLLRVGRLKTFGYCLGVGTSACRGYERAAFP